MGSISVTLSVALDKVNFNKLYPNGCRNDTFFECECCTNYGDGIDQLKNLINEIKYSTNF